MTKMWAQSVLVFLFFNLIILNSACATKDITSEKKQYSTHQVLSNQEKNIDLLSCILTDASCVQTMSKDHESESFIQNCEKRDAGTLQHKLCDMDRAYGKCVVKVGSRVEEFIHYKGKKANESHVKESCHLAKGTWHPVTLEEQALDEMKLLYQQRFTDPNGFAAFEKKVEKLVKEIVDGQKTQSKMKALESESWFDKAKFEMHREIWDRLVNQGGGCGTLATYLCAKGLTEEVSIPEIDEAYFHSGGSSSLQREEFYIKKGFCPLSIKLEASCQSYDQMKFWLDKRCKINIDMFENGNGHSEYVDSVGFVKLKGRQICWGISNSWGDPNIFEGGSGSFYHSNYTEYNGNSDVFYTTVCSCNPEILNAMKEQIKNNFKYDEAAPQIKISVFRFLTQGKNKEEIKKSLNDFNIDINKIILLSAIQKGGVEAVKKSINLGADINHQDSEGRTPIYVSAKYNRLDILETLIEAGADINIPEKNGNTPLLIASYFGHLDLVKILISSGADLNKGEKSGWTPLAAAADKGYLEIVKELVNAGAEIDKANIIGKTPIIFADENNHFDIVEFLLKSGANPRNVDLNKQNAEGKTLFDIACKNTDIELIKILAKHGVDINKPDKYYSEIPLLRAVRIGNLEFVKSLMEAGANVQATDESGFEAVQWAVFRGHIEIAKLLIAAGGDINKVNQDGKTLLEMAFFYENLETLKNLILLGVDIHKPLRNGYTPLVSAVRKNNIEIVKELLKAGAKVSQDLIDSLKEGEMKNLLREALTKQHS